jgi:hypothetical protein
MGRNAAEESRDDSRTVQEPAGKVEIDSHGNRVWRWAREVLESTSVLLKRLDNKDLAIEPTQKVPVISGGDKKKPLAGRGGSSHSDESDKARHPAARPDPRDGGGGFDPYNSR